MSWGPNLLKKLLPGMNLPLMKWELVISSPEGRYCLDQPKTRK
jgi:hypothetical protein